MRKIKLFEHFENDDQEPNYEAEWCEDCMASCEESGVEYTPDFTPRDGQWICDHCGGYC